jgi:ADP-heptose:LPS heptosyltransferase
LNAKVVLENNNPIDLNQLITLINNSKFVISNDTGPAHICSHLNKKGLVLFGNHTSSKKVSIKTKNLNILETKDLKDLSVDIVFKKTKEFLD